MWSFIISNAIEENAVRQDLLRDIAFLWVTSRGHSKAHQICLTFIVLSLEACILSKVDVVPESQEKNRQLKWP